MDLRTFCLREVVLSSLWLGVELREGERRLASIPDLTSVPPGFIMLPPEFANHMNDFDVIDLELSAAFLVPCLDHSKI